jgi:hypothetical protein
MSNPKELFEGYKQAIKLMLECDLEMDEEGVETYSFDMDMIAIELMALKPLVGFVDSQGSKVTGQLVVLNGDEAKVLVGSSHIHVPYYSIEVME